MIPAISALLAEQFGFDAEVLGPETVVRAIHKRMAADGTADETAYYLQVQDSSVELDKLGEELLVPETWFFRDDGPFEYLGRHVVEEWLKPGGERKRLLSMPCSTGEEPFIRSPWCCSMPDFRRRLSGSTRSTSVPVFCTGRRKGSTAKTLFEARAPASQTVISRSPPVVTGWSLEFEI